MNIIIHGVPVAADPSLPREKINALALDVIQSWNWECRELGRIELVRDAQSIHVCVYEKPSIRRIPNK